MSAQADIGPVVTVNAGALQRMSDAIIREAQIMRHRAAPGPRQDVRAALICLERLRAILAQSTTLGQSNNFGVQS